jgi:hypothetical protein
MMISAALFGAGAGACVLWSAWHIRTWLRVPFAVALVAVFAFVRSAVLLAVDGIGILETPYVDAVDWVVLAALAAAWPLRRRSVHRAQVRSQLAIASSHAEQVAALAATAVGASAAPAVSRGGNRAA